ncbi:MAG: Peptidoglycan-binding lysin domain protein [Candidatus Roizmanbacteria bacterium GW2011_GWA2_35_19]|uniref:Peptidoglycan-binding lysin domain protein n=2 Tax=Candidatus Roizmaniibacteriota TaxID=1752723 RepID=A0A0G0EDW0_9BACT|nr:MAG: Peptidoglycan-binding lysin domain protein [Candidatus Roizmanbacteria bacterium GW2011_GWC2_35_12]KKP73450.1 MAG: Peptidoglycan-binding lysin domain protein [Candidatus Roizmanbacteria bacterium GW2011_GWA2_35_19]
MKKRYIKYINYQDLFFATVKEKYINLILGMLVAFLISSLTYKHFLKNINFNLAINLPKFSIPVKKVQNKIVVKREAKTYIVEEGDDLWHIAEKFYGSGFNAYDISIANKLNDASILETGSKIFIPNVKRREATIGDISASATSQVIYSKDKYVVQPGDSLSIIALKVYGDLNAWTRILQANNLSSPDNIEVGMVLSIPR